MDWKTPIALEPRVFNELVKIEVVFTSGDVRVTHDFDLRSASDFDNFTNAVADQQKRISDLYSALAAFVPGAVGDPKPLEISPEKAFIILFNDWDAKRRELEASLADKVTTKLTQQDIDDAKSAWGAAYNETYWPLIAGRV